MFELYVFGVSFFAMLFFLLFIFRIRGEIVRLWGNPVAYFPRMRSNRPLRIKIRRGVLQTLSDEIVRLIDEQLLTLEKGKNGKVTLKPKEGVSEGLFRKWLHIREHPEQHTIWTTFAKVRWRWQGRKGRWVFFYHFFPHDEMTLRFGRHKVWRVQLLPNPIGFHAPSKEEWLRMKLLEAKKQGKQLTPDLKRELEKEYKRVKGRKWINVILHPTVTLTGEAQVFERLEGFQSLLPIIAHTMRTLGTKLAKYDALQHTVKSFQQYTLETKRQIEELVDKLGKTETLVYQQQRSLKEKGIPTVISPEASPMPFLPSAPSQTQAKPYKPRLNLQELDWSHLSIFIGIFFLVLGAMLYMGDSANWGMMFVGLIMFVMGAFMVWREKRSKVPVVEEVKEKVKEKKESIMEEGGK